MNGKAILSKRSTPFQNRKRGKMEFLCVEQTCTFKEDINASVSFVMTIPMEVCVDTHGLMQQQGIL